MYVGYVKQIAAMYKDPETKINSLASQIRDHIKADPRYLFTAEQFENNIAKTPGGLQVDESQTGGGFGGFGGDWGGGNWGGFVWAPGDNNGGWGGFGGDWGGGNWGGGFGGDWGGGFGFGGGFGGENVSVTDFLIKRYEVVKNALNF